MRASWLSTVAVLGLVGCVAGTFKPGNDRFNDTTGDDDVIGGDDDVQTPTCTGVTCGGHGSCSIVDGAAECSCDSGYHGQGANCIDDADPCAGQNCSGHGTCTPSGATASCDCADGFHTPSANALSCIADPQPVLAHLVWNAPTVNEDDSPVVDLAGYFIHYDSTGRNGNASYDYTYVLDVGMPSCTVLAASTQCEYDLTSIAGLTGTVYFTVTAYDYSANESAYSEEVSKAF